MMSLYERYRVLPVHKTDMEDLPMKGQTVRELEKEYREEYQRERKKAFPREPWEDGRKTPRVPKKRATSTAHTAKSVKRASTATKRVGAKPLARGGGEERPAEGLSWTLGKSFMERRKNRRQRHC